MTLVSESAQSVAIAAPDPVKKGHTLVLPKRHLSDYFDLSEREQRACWLQVNRVQAVLREQDASDTFRVGLNLDHPDRKTFKHAHLHVIPL
jgi:diadenosine tetraphosphate (Ap4A) HIT family hydrolase